MKVILIRHAEKLEWANGNEPTAEIKANYIDDHILSPKGYERAHALVGYFTKRKEILDIYKDNPLEVCIAQDVDSETFWGKSERPKETIWPLIEATTNHELIASKLTVQLFTKSKLDEMIALLKSWERESKTVLICWSHQQIPEIVSKLGFPSTKWNKKRFDICWVLDLKRKTFEQLPQLLLYGDQSL